MSKDKNEEKNDDVYSEDWNIAGSAQVFPSTHQHIVEVGGRVKGINEHAKANRKAPKFNWTGTLTSLVLYFEVLYDNLLIDEDTYDAAADFATRYFSINGQRINRRSFNEIRRTIDVRAEQSRKGQVRDLIKGVETPPAS